MDNQDFNRIEIQIMKLFESCENNFTRVVSRHHTPNANSFTFNYMINLCVDQTKIFESIISIFKAKNYFSEGRRMAVFIRQLKEIREAIETWGNLKA